MTLLLPSLLLFLSCGGESEFGCADDGDCKNGKACVKGTCRTVECSHSAQCAIHQFCNPFYECQDGCEQDTDCEAGEVCDTTAHTCTGYECRNTTLDCPVGEFCDEESGECETRGEYCEVCNEDNENSCGPGAYCFPYETGGDGYCWLYCDDVSDCPSGFECYELGAGYENVCIADCPWLEEQGYL